MKYYHCVINAIILIFSITTSSAFIIMKKSYSLPPSYRHRLLINQQTQSHNVKPFLLSSSSSDDNDESNTHNKISIKYCTGCRWMLRSTWMAQELLTTFQDEIDEVSLLPSRPPAPGGLFVITLNDDDVIWDRKEEGKMPDIKELKRLIRNKIMPNKDLGHADGHKKEEEDKELILQQEDEETEDYWVSSKSEVSDANVTSSTDNDDDDNDEFLDTRKYFGVA